MWTSCQKVQEKQRARGPLYNYCSSGGLPVRCGNLIASPGILRSNAGMFNSVLGCAVLVSCLSALRLVPFGVPDADGLTQGRFAGGPIHPLWGPIFLGFQYMQDAGSCIWLTWRPCGEALLALSLAVVVVASVLWVFRGTLLDSEAVAAVCLFWGSLGFCPRGGRLRAFPLCSSEVPFLQLPLQEKPMLR